jgi:hypothetical protein
MTARNVREEISKVSRSKPANMACITKNNGKNTIVLQQIVLTNLTVLSSVLRIDYD